MLREFARLIAPLQRRVRLMVTRAVVTLVDDEHTVQLLQLKLLAGETRDRVERLQTYGHTSVPLPGAHAVMVSIGGNHDLGIVVALEDPRHRPSHLDAGDSMMYDYRGQQIHLTAGGIVIRGAGMPVTITDTPKVRMECDLEVTGDIEDRCDANGKTMQGMRDTFNQHTHPENDAGGPTGTPIQQM